MKRKILLVDDDKVVRMIVELFLEKAGFDVTATESALDALSMLESGVHFDALISDYRMQGCNGRDLVTYARKLHPNISAMIITGFVDEEDLRGLPSAVIILPKPVRREELLVRLGRLLDAKTDF